MIRRYLSFLNSMKYISGLYYITLSCLSFYLLINYLHFESETIYFRIFAYFILGVGALSLFVHGVGNVRKGIKIVKNYTKAERDEIGDLLYGRVSNGEYL